MPVNGICDPAMCLQTDQFLTGRSLLAKCKCELNLYGLRLSSVLALKQQYVRVSPTIIFYMDLLVPGLGFSNYRYLLKRFSTKMYLALKRDLSIILTSAVWNPQGR